MFGFGWWKEVCWFVDCMFIGDDLGIGVDVRLDSFKSFMKIIGFDGCVKFK